MMMMTTTTTMMMMIDRVIFKRTSQLLWDPRFEP